MVIKDGVGLDQIHVYQFKTVAETMSKTSFDMVDFERAMRLRSVDREVVVREFMLLKTGMFETWEVLYHHENS